MSLKQAAAALFLKTPLPETMFRRKSAHRLTVLAYHRIMPLPDGSYPFDAELVSATPEEFEREMRYFQKNADLLSMSELYTGLTGDALPERPVVVTFDDGYRDNYEIALPILQSLKLPACFFLCSRLVESSTVPWWDAVSCCMKHSKVERIDSPFENDPPYRLAEEDLKASLRRFLDHLKTEPWPKVEGHLQYLSEKTGVNPQDYLEKPLFVTWKEAQGFLDAGMEIGGHSRTHPVLSHLDDPAALDAEISGCFTDLQEKLGRAPLAFAYPVGSPRAMSEATEQALQQSGFKLWFSHIHSLTHKASVFPLPRLHSEYGGDYGAFRLGMARAPLTHISGGYGLQ